MKIFKRCKECGKKFFKKDNKNIKRWNKRMYCSFLCVGKSNKGSKHSEETRKKIREARAKQIIPKESYIKRGKEFRKEKHWNWKGGYPKCLDCGKQLYRYASKRCKKCDGKRKRRENHYRWKGGTFKDGYFIKSITGEKGNERVREHRLIVEKYIGRKLKRFEIIHHINEIKDDNRIENLYLFKSIGKHNGYHHRLRFGHIEKITKSNLF